MFVGVLVGLLIVLIMTSRLPVNVPVPVEEKNIGSFNNISARLENAQVSLTTKTIFEINFCVDLKNDLTIETKCFGQLTINNSGH